MRCWNRVRRRRALTFAELLVVIMMIAVLTSMVIAAIQQVRQAARRAQCQDHIRNIVLGMHNYATSNRAKLPGDKNKRSGGANYKFNARFSMYADLLPFVEFDAVADRLNYKSPEPFLKKVGLDPRTGVVRSIEFKTFNGPPGSAAPTSDGGWVVGAKGERDRNKSYEVLSAVVPIFLCPSDPIAPTAQGSLNYPPVVTPGLAKANGGGGRFLDARTGVLIEATWPPDDDATISSPIPDTLEKPGSEGAGEAFFNRLNPVTLDFMTGADGTSNTVGIVERCKGPAVMGREVLDKNVALVGLKSVPGYVVSRTGLISPDASASVAECRALLNGAKAPVPSLDHALAGATYLQHTCAWLGCANLLSPVNAPVCRGSTSLIAQTGLVGPSSYHSGGANVGVFDGTVRYLTDQTDLKILHAYSTPAGRENHPDVE